MKVYFITQKDMGDHVILKPRIPESAPDYEGNIPRICVSPSILGALSSIGRHIYIGCYTYVYVCELDESELIQAPSSVNDADMTGEFWILIEKEFKIYKTLKITDEDSFIVDEDKEIEICNFKFELIKEISR